VGKIATHAAVPENLHGVAPIGRENGDSLGIGTVARHMGAVLRDVVIKQKRPSTDKLVLDGLLLGDRAARHHGQAHSQCRNAKNVPPMHVSSPLRHYIPDPANRRRFEFHVPRIGRWDFPYSGPAFNRDAERTHANRQAL
jgi:hypothetical protein